jgi:AcrR family transcriptional regulator
MARTEARADSGEEPDDRPSGRQDTVDAIVRAASELFAARGPDGVSLRDVAAKAGVNYGLIHQYVGTRDELLRLVFRSVSDGVAQDFNDAVDIAEILQRLMGPRAAGSQYVAMLAWALLQGRDATDLLGRSPALTALIGRMGGAGGQLVSPDDPRVLVAAVTAMVLGWRLFGPFVQAGVGLEEVPEDIMTAGVRAVAGRLLDA